MATVSVRASARLTWEGGPPVSSAYPDDGTTTLYNIRTQNATVSVAKDGVLTCDDARSIGAARRSIWEAAAVLKSTSPSSSRTTISPYDSPYVLGEVRVHRAVVRQAAVHTLSILALAQRGLNCKKSATRGVFVEHRLSAGVYVSIYKDGYADVCVDEKALQANQSWDEALFQARQSCVVFTQQPRRAPAA